MAQVSDMDLLREYARQGSEAAFGALVQRHVNLVYSVALRHVGIAAHAEEITQAVFIILARKAAALRPDTILEGWLHETTRLTALSFLRGERRRQFREQEAYMQSTLRDSTNDAAWNQLAPLLDEAIARLGKNDRDAVMLRFFKNESVREIAAAMKVSEPAAQRRVLRALEKLRRFFSKRGVVLPVAALTAAITANSVRAAPAALANTATAAALAKGAAAGGSTLLLVKGALKIMAWTKAKSAIAVSVMALVVASTGLELLNMIHALRVSRYPDIQGAWEGIAHLDDEGVAKGGPTSTHLVLKLTKTNGVYSATTDWIEKGRKDVRMGAVVYDYPSLKIEQNPRSTWNLTVHPIANEIVWAHGIHFIQPDPVALRRTATPDEVPEPLTESEITSRPGSDLQGYWKGTIANEPLALPVDLKIAEQADGTFRAEADNPMQGADGQPANVIYERPNVKLTLATGAGMFVGTINSARTEISGSWIQGGNATPAMVRRADYHEELEQEAAKDYSFASENDLQGHWKGSWILPFAGVKVKMRFLLDIAKLPDGNLSAALSSIDQFGAENPVPASDFQFSPPDLSMQWKWEGCAYTAKLEHGKLIGTWQEGDGSFPLVFERSRPE